MHIAIPVTIPILSIIELDERRHVYELERKLRPTLQEIEDKHHVEFEVQEQGYQIPVATTSRPSYRIDNISIIDSLIIGRGFRLNFAPPIVSRIDKHVKIKDYTIRGIIGRGGFAVTLLVTDDVGRNYVLKIPYEALDSILYGHTLQLSDKDAAKFLNEVNVLKAIEHPHIVKVVDGGVYADIPFMVMEYCENGSLRGVLNKQGKLSLREALILGIQLADALSYLHSKGIIHRDLKPENILFTRDGIAKITDFNISKIMSTVSTTSRSKNYTLGYAAPEQLFYDLGPTSDKTDVWALGIILYEAITGQKPFSTENYIDEIKKKQPDLTPLPEEIRPIISQMLSIKPQDRPPITHVKRELLKILSTIYNTYLYGEG